MRDGRRSCSGASVAWRARGAFALLLCVLCQACTERPPRFDVPPPSYAARYAVDVEVTGRPSLETPVGFAGGVLGGALAGGAEACVLSYGVLCAVAPVMIPLTAAGGLAGLAIAETPVNIARAKHGLQQQDIRWRVGPCLRDAIIALGNRRPGYRFRPAGANSETDRETSSGRRMALHVVPVAVGLTQGNGQLVLVLRATGKLEAQDLGEFSSSSPPRSVSQWLESDGQAINEALASACASIAGQALARVLAGR